jgi:hypothetical protein
VYQPRHRAVPALPSLCKYVLQDPDPSVKGDLPRFLWNFLAERIATPKVLYSLGFFECHQQS